MVRHKEAQTHGREVSMHSSSFPHPLTIDDEKLIPTERRPNEACSPNLSHRDLQQSPRFRHRHSYPLSNEAKKDFQSVSVSASSPFHPLTTTTVTTAIHHPFQYQGQHRYDVHRQNYHRLYHPYHLTPSFDSIATAATAVAAATASSAWFSASRPLYQQQTDCGFQATEATPANQISLKSRNPSSSHENAEIIDRPKVISANSNRDYKKLANAELDAIEALLGIHAASDGKNSPRSKSRNNSI